MKIALSCIFLLLGTGIFLPSGSLAQKAGLNRIDTGDLEAYLSVLASDDMEGRATGEPGLDRASQYLARQAAAVGLKPADRDGDYFQEYTLVNKEIDPDRSYISILRKGETESRQKSPIYLLNPDSILVELDGEAVFAGYGIYSGEDDYNDFEGIDVSGKIVLVMNRGPLDESGEVNLLSNRDWKGGRSYQYKMPALVMRGAKAVLVVMDPKSGYESLEEYSGRMARYLNRSRYVKELGEGTGRNYMPTIATKILFVHREVAEQIIAPSGMSLAALQDSIDRSLKPHSFELPGTRVDIQVAYSTREKRVPNVVGLVEGTDPVLKKELIVYTAHFDHLGVNDNGEVYNGADDNASGTVALIELAEAFMAEKKNLKRSVMILWVSGEEIGLFGSRFYSENPLVPLENTIANLNLDMIGAVRRETDRGMIHGEKVSVLGMDSVALIGGFQSSDLMDIHNQVMDRLGMFTDSSMNQPDHPYRYFYRSDHINFARHDIPVLFYSTGIHPDYHMVTDDYLRINFEKLKKVTELSFLVGYELATRKERIEVDNPFSDWGQMAR